MDCGIIKNQPQKKHNLSRNPNSSTEFTSLSQNNSMSYSIRQQTYSKEPITLIPPMKNTIDITPMKKHNPSFFLNQASSRSTDKKNTIDSSTVSFPRISKLRSNSNINININITNVSPKRNPPPQKNRHLNRKLKFDTSIFNSFDKQNTLGVSNSCENIYHTNNSGDHPILRLTKKRPFNSPADKITFSSVLTDRRPHRKIGSYEFRGDLVVNKDILKCDQLLNKIKQRNSNRKYISNKEKLSLGQDELFQIKSPKFEIKKTKKCLTIINEEKKTITEGTGSLESTQKLTKKNPTKKSIHVPSPTKKVKSNIFHFNQNVKFNKNNNHKDSIRHSLSSDYLGMFEIKPKPNTLHFLDSKCLDTSFTLKTESTVLSTIYSKNKILKHFYKDMDKKEKAYYNASEKKNIMIKQKTIKFKNELYSNYSKRSSSYFNSIDTYYSSKGTTMYYKSIYYDNNSEYPYEVYSPIEKDCSLKYPLTDYIIMNYLMIDSDIASEYLFQNKVGFFESYNITLPKKEKIKATKSGIISGYVPTFQTQDQRDNMLYIQKAIYQDYILMKELYGYTTTEDNEIERKRHKTTRTVRTRKGKNTFSLNVLQHKNFYYWRKNNKYSYSQMASSLASKLLFRKNSDISPTGKTKENGLTYLVRRSTVMSSQDIMKMLTNSSDLFDALIKLLKMNQIALFKDAFVRSKSEIQIDQVDNEGNTLLIYACIAGSLEAVKLLIEGGADPNIQNVSNNIFTHYHRT